MNLKMNGIYLTLSNDQNHVWKTVLDFGQIRYMKNEILQVSESSLIFLPLP